MILSVLLVTLVVLEGRSLEEADRVEEVALRSSESKEMAEDNLVDLSKYSKILLFWDRGTVWYVLRSYPRYCGDTNKSLETYLFGGGKFHAIYYDC